MDKKILSAIAVVAILVVASVSIYLVTGDDDHGEPTELDKAELKVYGNINGDRFLDNDDVAVLNDIIKDGKTVDDYPLADANQDGVLNQSDVDLVNDVIDGKKSTIWHINYFDIDGDGTMDEQVESTKFPITATIFNGSSNLLIYLFNLGIVDEVKGCTYGSTADKGLFSTTYFNPDKCVKLGTSSSSITFEDGKAGSSNVIAEEGVTAVISNWNRAQLGNWETFEANGIDVVRVAASDMDVSQLTHSAMLMGLLFQKVDRANSYVDMNLEILNYIHGKVSGAKKVMKAAASSSDGSLSSATSDYTGFILEAGAEFALKDFDFGGSSGLKVADRPDVFLADMDKIVHFRTNISYDQTAESNKSYWDKYTAYFSDWKNAEEGQYVIGGTMPVILRVAYAAVALYPDLVTIEEVNDYHKEIVKKFYNGLEFDIDSMNFLLYSGNMN